jgi:hypothetical protein
MRSYSQLSSLRITSKRAIRMLLTMAAIVCVSSQALGQGATWRQNALKACKTDRCRDGVDASYEESLSQGVKFMSCVETFSLATALSRNESAQSVVSAGVAACSRELGSFQETVRSMIADDPRYTKAPQEELEKLGQQWTDYIIRNATSQVLPAILVLRATQNQNRRRDPEGAGKAE